MQGMRINHNAPDAPRNEIRESLDRLRSAVDGAPLPPAPSKDSAEYDSLVNEITRLSLSTIDRYGLELETMETKNASIVFGVFKGLLAAIDAFSFSESSLRITKSDVVRGRGYNIQFKIEGEEIMVDLIPKGGK